ncbi:hypothetical protein NXW50_31010 [Bacteroides thetaiotaomicron]|nr:hypothetical protein [Bacteroides thetaiotaomicron]MCS2282396.1 hypothetical protein [Bacteroides thetaiotaomicron]
MTWENLYQKDSVRNRSHAVVHPVAILIRLLFSSRTVRMTLTP